MTLIDCLQSIEDKAILLQKRNMNKDGSLDKQLSCSLVLEILKLKEEIQNTHCNFAVFTSHEILIH